MARPIPKRLLPHSVGYEKKSGEGSRGPVYDTSIAIDNVLVQLKEVLKKTKNGYEVVGKAVMMYDYTNSSPNTVIFSNRDKITFDGIVYFVNMKTEQPTLQGKHHVEVVLA